MVHSHSPRVEFYYVLFLASKKNGQMRPVINLKDLKSVGRHPPPPPLQNGRSDLFPGSAEAGRLVA